MPTVASFWRANAGEAGVVRAFLFSSKRKLGVCALRDKTREPFFQQKWQFRVPGEISEPARTAKTLLHEMDLKVAELTRNWAAKCLTGLHVMTSECWPRQTQILACLSWTARRASDWGPGK
jgi:hypothetical protein